MAQIAPKDQRNPVFSFTSDIGCRFLDANIYSLCTGVKWLFWIEKGVHIRTCKAAMQRGTRHIMENMASWRPRNKLGEKSKCHSAQHFQE